MAKFKNYDEATKAVDESKKVRTAAKEALEAFCKTNKIKKGTPSSEVDKKLRGEYKTLTAAYQEARKAVDEASEAAKALKPAKVRETKYDYPADCVTAEQKKKFRTAARAAAKRAEKPAKADKPAKSEKSAKENKKSGKKAGKKSGSKNKPED